jgi:DNA-binding LacI/PurR family transcriptional regulator
LLRQGYKRLVLLEPFVAEWLTERISGARDAIRHADLPDDTLQVYSADFRHQAYDREPSMASLHDLARTLFGPGWEKVVSNANGPSAIVAPNDDSAFAVLEVAAEQTRVVGKDFGLLGFDDDPRACAVGLTTVRPPIEAMGEEAGQLLLRSLHGDRRSQIVRLRSHVIPRASTSLRLR